MKQDLQRRREERQKEIRHEAVQRMVRKKRQELNEAHNLMEQKQCWKAELVVRAADLSNRMTCVEDVRNLLASMQGANRQTLNHKAIVYFLIETIRTLIANNLVENHQEIFRLARSCLNNFLSSSDEIVVPYLHPLVDICTHPLLVGLFYNISLIEAWQGDLKRSYFTTFLNILEVKGTAIKQNIDKLINFTVSQTYVLGDEALCKTIHIINQQIISDQHIAHQNIQQITELLKNVIISEKVANYVLTDAEQTIEFVLQKLKYPFNLSLEQSENDIKSNCLQVLICLMKYPSTCWRMFTRHELLSAIIRRRLCDQIPMDKLIKLIQIIITDQDSLEVVIKDMLEQLISLAFASSKTIRRPTKQKFKKILMKIAISANDLQRQTLLNNNFSCLLVSVIKCQNQPQLTLLGLECLQHLLNTQMEDQDRQQCSSFSNRLKRELQGRYNIKPVLNYLCDSPNQQISLKATRLLDSFWPITHQQRLY